MKKLSLIVVLMSLFFSVIAQKTALTHKDYDHWKSIRNHQISKDGTIVTYEINPQKGDGKLFIYNTSTKETKKFDRAKGASISPTANFVIFRITPAYDTIRQKKLKKVKRNKMPKDTLALLLTKTNKISKITDYKSFKISQDASNWFAYTYTKIKKKKKKVKDTIKGKISKRKIKKKKASKKKKVKLKGNNLVILNPIVNKRHEYKNVTSYYLSKNGATVIFTQETGDTLKINNLCSFNTKTEQLSILSKGEHNEYRKLTIDNEGQQLAYLFTNDTLKTKVYSLVLKSNAKKEAKTVVDTTTKEIYKNWTASIRGSIYFSKNGKKLYFGVAPKPVKKAKDTLLKSEKYRLDVWGWNDGMIQPQQKVKAAKEKNRTYRAIYNIKEKKVIQLADKHFKNVRITGNGNKKYAYAYDNEPYAKLSTWDTGYYDVYLVNTKNGERIKVLTKSKGNFDISPSQKYIVYYNTKDSIWYSYNIKKAKHTTLTKNIKQNFYNELNDMPVSPKAYGLQTWTKDDKYVLIADRYDIWKIDPTGKQKAINLTASYGRTNNIKFRYVDTDSENDYITEAKLLLSAFNENNKMSGYFSVNINGEQPKELIYEKAAFDSRSFKKAEKADKILWRKGTFEQYPELTISEMDFKNAKVLSNTNPQQKDYNWGTVEMVNWTSGDGEKLNGLLYKPEDFDPNKKYPMLVYFYERSTNGLYSHHIPQPNWSIINRSYCVSNGYLVFVPDITYHKVGYPGECAYSAIVTGTLAMLDRYKFIDKDNLALQGQSWGGYQIAHLVTRTNLYKCAMAGAPVSNMTSAYGGIRWQSGMSRQFQYEHTQSRIGGTLWNSTIQYIENSPIFFAPKIKTPLLIMHNDHDGAVPWYQGIELFMAMRRLSKPCWMLSYNNEGHNLRGRANKVDLSIRTMQFFDYYLKGAKQPMWMKSGVPAYKKDSYTGYELAE